MINAAHFIAGQFVDIQGTTIGGGVSLTILQGAGSRV